jgi:hypothetical protein
MATFSAKRLLVTVAVIVAAAAVLAVGKRSLDWYMDPMRVEASLLAERRETAKRIGLALHPDDLMEERAARLDKYEEFVRFEQHCLKSKNLKQAFVGGMTSGTTAKRMAEDQEAHRLLMEACALGNVDTPFDWGLGISGKPMDLHIFSRYVNSLCALAESAAEQHDVLRAADYLTNAASLAEGAIDEPNNRALITWTSCAQRVLRGAYSILEKNPNAEGIAAAKRLLDSVKPPTDLKAAVRNECLIFQVSARQYDAMSYLEKSNLQLGSVVERIEPPTGKSAAEAIESRSLQFWIDATNAATPKDGDLQSAGRDLDEMCRSWTEDRQLASYLSLGLTPIFEQTGTAIMRVQQIKTILSATIEVLSRYVANGSLPRQLDGYSDPITRGPLKYRAEPDRFSIQATSGDDWIPPIGDLLLIRGHGYAVTFELPN